MVEPETTAAPVDLEVISETLREEFKQFRHELKDIFREELQALLQAPRAAGDIKVLPPPKPSSFAGTGAGAANLQVHTKSALKKVQPKIPELIDHVWDSAQPMRGHRNQEIIRRFMEHPNGTQDELDGVHDMVKLRSNTMKSMKSYPSEASRRSSKSTSTKSARRADSGSVRLADEINAAAACELPIECLDVNGIDSCEVSAFDAEVEGRNSTMDVNKKKRAKEDPMLHRALGLLKKSRTTERFTVPADELHRSSPIRQKLFRLVTNSYFEFVTLVLIFANAITIGVQTDYMARNKLQDEPRAARVFTVFFCFVFTAEIVLKLIAFRCRFFRMWGFAWNIFDLILVCMQIIEEFIRLVADEKASVDSTLLRTVRVLRALRVVRVLRIMAVAETLQLLVTGILHSFASFFWSCALLFLMVYIISIYLTQLVSTRIVTGEVNSAGRKDLEKYYDNVPVAMLSLIQALLGGIDWRDIVSPLISDVGWWLGVCVVIWIIFSLLAVLNIITGNFVQSSLEGAAEIKNEHRLNYARKMFVTLDVDASGEISFDELGPHLQDPVVQDFFASLDIDITEARSLFELIDMDNSGVIDFEEFLSGCMRLQGPAKATDLLLVTRDFRRAFEQQGLALATLEQHICCIKDAMLPLDISPSTMNTLGTGSRSMANFADLPGTLRTAATSAVDQPR